MAAVLKDIPVPDIGDFKDIEVIEVLVKAGDVIRPEDSLITLESDKAAMEVPSPFGGKVARVDLKPGDRVSQGSLILALEVDADADVSAAPVEPSPVADTQSGSPAEFRPLVSEPSAPSPVSSDESETLAVTVPDIGDFKDIEVIEVLVKPGDVIAAETSLITLESDKAAMEVPSPRAGVVREVLLKPGDRVSQGRLILHLEITPKTGQTPTTSSEPPSPLPASGPVAQASLPSSSPAPSLPQPASVESGGIPPRASPAVRKFARELGVDLRQVVGTAQKSRVTREDVQQYVKSALAGPASASGPLGSGWAFPPLPKIDFSRFGPVETRPLTRIQKRSGPNLHRNWVSIPHITQHEEADITDLEAFRVALKDEAARRGVKLSLLPLVMKAVAACLKAFPTFNASLSPEGDSLILKSYVHIGVAVDTPEGLVVPVVRDVDRLTVFDLAEALQQLSQKARDKKLKTEDLEGGCFTLSSLGGIGGTGFTPIINAPEVAILGLSRSQMKPIFVEGQFVPRLMLPLSLSYDHRVIDGAEAARFIVHLSRVLQDLRRVLL